MAHIEINRKQLIKTDIDSLWDFMSSPKNLEEITPKWMRFEITSNNKNDKMFEGMTISYKITPVLKFPLKWTTRITSVKNKVVFIDEQIKGPYKIWKHEHRFEKTKEGIMMYDIVRYVPPLSLIGKIANILFIEKKVNKIFDYRRDILNKKFNTKYLSK